MRGLTWIALGLLLPPGLGMNRALASEPGQVELAWSEISPLIVGGEVALALPDGTYIQGKALAVEADALEIDVKKTSDRRLHPKGRMTIPRGSASVIELRKTRKFPVGAIVGGGAGYVGGALLGALIGWGVQNIGGSDTDFPAGALLGGQVGAIAGAIVGGRAGHNLDRRNTLIKVIPESPHPENAEPKEAGSEAMDLGDAGLEPSEAQTGVISEVVKAGAAP